METSEVADKIYNTLMGNAPIFDHIPNRIIMDKLTDIYYLSDNKLVLCLDGKYFTITIQEGA